MMTATFLIVLVLGLHSFFKIATAPASFIYMTSMAIGAALPIQFSNNVDVLIDSTVAVSIIIVYVFSRIRLNKNVDHIQAEITHSNVPTFLLISSFLFLLPGIALQNIPLFTAVEQGLLEANYARAEVTKGGRATQIYLILVFRLGLMFSAFIAGYVFFLQSWSVRYKILSALIIAMATSVIYVQKSNPIMLLAAFFMGLVFSRQMNTKTIALFTLLFASQLFVVGLALYGWGGAVDFVKDMAGRRMTSVPMETLRAHFDLFQEFGPLYLKHSFTFLSGNQPLPSLAHYQLGGYVDFGWANSHYIGDLFANFGIFGAVFFSIIIGLIIKKINDISLSSKKWKLKYLSMFVGGAFIFALANNAFFSGVQFVFLIIIFTSLMLKPRRIRARKI